MSARPATVPPAPFADYPSLLAHLDALGLFHITPGLERIIAVLKRLGLRRPPFWAVQVVGTNGKGSTSTMLAQLAETHGMCTGLYTSPHFISPRERIRINGSMLSENEWTHLANTVMAAGGQELSYFEIITAMAVLAFAEAEVALAVIETGLGGTWDATTALNVDMVLFTPIAMDHQLILGPTLRHIAADKAGAMRPGVPALTRPQSPKAHAELLRAAQEKSVPLTILDADSPLPEAIAGYRTPMALSGTHQLDNARLALVAWRMLSGMKPPSTEKTSVLISSLPRLPKSVPDLEVAGLAKAWLPGRMQRALPKKNASGGYSPCSLGRPALLLDGAHNAHGISALGLALAREGIAPGAVIFAALEDKNPEQLVPHLRALATGPIFVPPITGNPRAMPPQELADLIGLNAVPTASLREAFELACRHMAERIPEAFEGSCPKTPLLICGSLYLLGEVYALFPDLLERPD